MSDLRMIGPYAIERVIGEGGMGTVYLARRADEAFDTQVAIKVMRRATSDGATVRRFERERQILADLSHPGVARLVDGGQTDEGLPYLVMEYVKGMPIDTHCAERQLSQRARLGLFLEVCDAVQHAHGQLVVHTDLKPANILVDADGRVRLLDFGIAKLLDHDGDGITEGSSHTTLRPMTPAYASPEQMRGEPVATSTDVYSLGVVLYELLTGQLPYPEDQRSGRSLEDAVLAHEPAAPSRVVDQITIDTDLDTIALKVLQKDPLRRYESVEQLADDVRRYLDGEPIRARPDSLGYRMSKFARRHRGAVGSSAVAAALIVTFAAVSRMQAAALTVERDAAQVARTEAEAVTDFLVDVFDATDPNVAQGLDLTARDILGGGARRVREELGEQPAVQAAVASAIGEAYLRLGAFDSAAVNFSFAAERAEIEPGTESIAFARALSDIARTQNSRSVVDSAEANLRRSLEIMQRVVGPDAVETGMVWNNIGSLMQDLALFDEAESAYLQALRIREAELGSDHPWTIVTLNNLGTLYTDWRRHDEAILFSKRALEARESMAEGVPTMDVARSLNNVGSALEYAGRYEEAEPYYLRSLEIRRELLDENHTAVLTALNNLGGLYIRDGRAEEAVPIFERVISGQRESGQEPMRLATSLSNYATALVRSGRNEDAIDPLQESETLIEQSLGPAHPLLAFPRQSLGAAYEALGRVADAEEQYRRALRVREGALADDHVDVAFVRARLGSFLLSQGRIEEAESLLERSYAVRDTALAADHPDRLDSLLKMGRLRARQGRVAEARTLLDEAVVDGTEGRGADDPVVAAARALLDSLGVAGR